MKIKGAIFDCDGTLVNSLHFWDIFYDKISERFFGGAPFSVESADDKAMRTQPISFLASLLHEKYGVGDSPRAVADFTNELFVWFYREEVDLKAGVKELLSHLKKNGIPMCIATASEASLIRIVLEKHGVMDCFGGIVDCSSVGRGKDAPDVFFAAEKFLGTPHGATWVFEDSLLAMQTAKSAGFPVVGIYDSHTFGQDTARTLCDVYVDDGHSLDELIYKLEV